MAHEIDYKIHQSQNELLEIALDPVEGVVTETGSMIMMEEGIELLASVGDGSKREKGIFGKIIGSGKRMITGEGLFMTKLVNNGTKRGNVVLSPGGTGSKIIPIDLSKTKESFLCNKGHFLGAALGVNVGMNFRFRPLASFVGSAEIITQELDGNGFAFLKSDGPVYYKRLQQGEKISIDQHALVGFSSTVSYNIKFIKNIKSIFLAGEGLVLYEITGPGLIVLQGYNELELKQREELDKRYKNIKDN